MSIAWEQGFDLTLFSAYDWEHLRKRLVNLPTQALTNKDKMKRPKKPVEEVKNAFVGVEKIQVKNPKSTLYPKTGFEWHWTHIGFQPLIKGNKEKQARVSI